MADCKNAQFLEWVKEWWDQARDRNSKGASTYKKAYDSLKACPITYEHPAQLTALVGFGPVMCGRLTKKLEDLCTREGRPMPQKNKRKRKDDDNDEGEDGAGSPSPVKKSKPRKKAEYIPKFETGPYGIVLALATLDEDEGNGLTKAEVIEIAQPYCTASYTTPMNQGSFFTAWSTMKTLIDKELVFARGRPSTRYSLSDDGWDLAKRILASVDPSKGIHQLFKGKAVEDQDENSFQDIGSDAEAGSGPSKATNNSGAPDIIAKGKTITSAAALPKVIPIMVEPGAFTIELVVDVREIRSKTDRDYMQNNLIKRGIKPIMKALDLGDVIWIAKLYDENYLSQRGAEGSEVMLDYIVERKRLDDLVSSIKDRRFTEQKFRLEKSGVKNKIYIIEEYSSVDSNYDTHIATAIASTQVINNFFVKKTQRMDDTIDYLVRMTHILKKKYESHPLRIIPTNIITTGNYLPLLAHLAKIEPRRNYHITFPAFSSLSSKSDSLTLRDVYLKMLMCTRGLTGEKAIEVQKRWPTPNALAAAYREIEKREGGGEQARKVKREMVWREMGELVGRRKIQKALSAKIADVWGEWESKDT